MNATDTMLTSAIAERYLVDRGLGSRRRRSAFILLVVGLLTLLIAGASAAGALVLDGRPEASTDTMVGSDASRVGAALPSAGSTAASIDRTTSGQVDDRDRIRARWDGPTVQLDWRGKTYASTEASFVGDRVASPGDRVVRTLDVKNAGPSAAVMSVALEVDQRVPASAVNDDLAQHIILFWNVDGVHGESSYAALLRGGSEARHLVAELRVARAGVTPVQVGFRMDRAVTAGRRLGHPSTVLPFNVIVRMHGNTPDPGGHLAATGLSRYALPLAVLGALLLLIGLALVAARRRTCDICRRVLAKRDGVVWHLGADRRLSCHACFGRWGHASTSPGAGQRPGLR